MPVTASHPLGASETTESRGRARLQNQTRRRTFLSAEAITPMFVVIAFTESAPNELSLVPDVETASRATFERLRDEWKSESSFTSSITEKALASSYQQIIEMGSEALPLILKELQDDLDHWF